MDTIKEIQDEQAKGIHSLFNACMYREECRQMGAEHEKLLAALDTAMKTLEQIATTPRNAGAKRNASATLHFLRTQMETPNARHKPRGEATSA